MELVGAALVLGMVVLGIWALGQGAQQQAQRRVVTAEALGGVVDADGRLDVPCGGLRVAVSFTLSGSGSYRTHWTYLEAAMPAGYALALHLRPHRNEDAIEIERDELLDIQIDVPEFDDAFLIEGAPADVVRRLINPQVQATLLRQPPIKIDAADGVLQVMLSGWHEDAAAIRPWVELVGSIAGGVRDAYAAADAAIPLAATGGVYREIPDDQPLQAARAARFAEVQRLGEIRKSRSMLPAVVIGLFGLIVLLIVLSQPKC
jgi:hypothetical protein